MREGRREQGEKEERNDQYEKSRVRDSQVLSEENAPDKNVLKNF